MTTRVVRIGNLSTAVSAIVYWEFVGCTALLLCITSKSKQYACISILVWHECS